MKYSIELGVRNSSLDTVAAAAGKFFGVTPEERYSDYMGGDYFLIKNVNEQVLIQLNKDCDDIAEEEHPDVAILVIVVPTSRPQEIRIFFESQFDSIVIREESY